MNDLVERLEQSIRKHCLLRNGQPVLIAVSGGVDSMVLLTLLHQLSRVHHWRLRVAHLNHLLRGKNSMADEKLVRNAARKLKVPLTVERADVRQVAKEKKLSLEMAARKLRHEFLARVAVRSKTPAIALAHHADDQIELFFLRLFRGSGGEGLAGMRWRSPSPANQSIELIRPLLDVSKTQLRAYASANKIPFREDATNRSLQIQRNRIRQELLPLLHHHYQPALDQTLPRVMELIGAEAEFACETARKWLSGIKSDKSDPNASLHSSTPRGEGLRERGPILSKAMNSGLISLVPFVALPRAVQRWVLQLQLRELEAESDFALVEELRSNPEKPVNASNGKTLVMEKNGFLQWVKTMPTLFKTDSVDVKLTQQGKLTFHGANISWRILNGVHHNAGYKMGQELYDAALVGQSITVRHWRPGDRFQPIGMASSVKLQDLFTNQKVPRERRHQLVVATTSSGELFWVEGLRISERFKLRNSSNRRLLWRWRRL